MATTRKKTAKKTAKKSTAATSRKKPAGKKKYGAAASKKVRAAIEEMNDGTLTSGRSGKKVTDRKQAIAIGLSEARRRGGKVPEPPPK